MSKQSPKPRTPGPYDPPSASNRKVSSHGPSKFYDGPTVSAKTEELKNKTAEVTAATSTQIKRRSKQAMAKARRHPWSIASILTTIPFLLTMTLLSTVICPPPNSNISPISKFVLSPLGLHDHSGEHSNLHQTLCYPSNVYHEKVLQPYIYPIIDDLQTQAHSHPIYVKGVQPAYNTVLKTSKQAWDGPVGPIVKRIQRGARKIYLTFVEPHLPYLRKKYTAITAPYTSRISAFHRQNIAPHLQTAGRHAHHLGKRSADTYSYVATHPYTNHANRYAQQGYQFSKVKGQQAYEYSRPHAIRAVKEAERIAREILGPRAVKAFQWAGVQSNKAYGVARLHASRLYLKHLDPYVGTHIARAHTIISPYIAALKKNVYQPYIFPLLESILPKAVMAPEPPKSFWSLIADILPGSHVAESKVNMKEYQEKVKEARKPANVRVPGAEKVAKAESVKVNTESAKKFDREEMNRVREAVKERVEQQGKKGYENVRKELLDYYTHILADDDKFQSYKKSSRLEAEREFDYLIKGLDKLYTTSTTLTKEQIDKSSMQAEARVAKKIQQLKERGRKLRKTWVEGGKSIAQKASNDLDAALGTEWVDLKIKMEKMDGVTAKDWTDYDKLKTDAEAWKAKYAALASGDSKDRALNAPSANVNRAISSWSTELTDLFEAWRDQTRLLRKTAYERVEAREALASESISTAARVQSASAFSADNGRVSILPIVEAGEAAAATANGIIGKGKEQILDAFSQASAVAAGGVTPTGVADQARSAASSAYDAVSSGGASMIGSSILPIIEAGAAAEAVNGIIGKGKEQILDAYSQASAVAAGGVTPTGVVDQAKSAASSAYDAASSGVHEATRSAMSAVGATPSPEGAREHLESIANVVKGGYAAVADHVGQNIHDSTRAGLSAVGATPSPENIGEHAQSIASQLSASATSLASDALNVAGSYASAASSVVHDGTRAAAKAVGVIPTPETPGEYVESIVSVASASAGSVAAAAASVVHDGTRSVISAAGGTPSPESPVEYAQSAANAASSAANSVYTEAAASASSAYSVAASGAGAAGSAVTDQAIALGQRIQEALGLVSTPEPYASSVSAYLASASAVAATGVPDLLASGQSLLASIQAEAASSLHQATRAASRAVGATPTPETPGEYVEDAQARVKSVAGQAGSVVQEYASRVSEEAGRVTESVKKAVGRDEL